jgi:hypothetical protein
MGLVWGVTWAVIGGGIMEAFVDPHGEILDMWPQTLGVIGFVGGVVFSILLGLVAGRRRFAELSFAQFALLGVAAGVLQGAFAMTFGAPATFIVFTAVASAIAGCASLALARMAQGRRSLRAHTDVAGVAPDDDEARR